MTHSGIRTRQLWLPNCGDTPHICIKRDNNDSAHDSARRGQNQEKENETPTNELNIFLSIFFPTVNNKISEEG